MASHKHAHVERREGVCGGAPVVKGTRIPIWILASYWRSGVSPDELLTYYPHLTIAQIFGALSYYADHQPDIDVQIAANRVTDAKIHPLIREARQQRKLRVGARRKPASPR